MDKETALMYYNFISNIVYALLVTNMYSMDILNDIKNAIKVLNKNKHYLSYAEKTNFKKLKKIVSNYSSSTSHTVSSSSWGSKSCLSSSRS